MYLCLGLPRGRPRVVLMCSTLNYGVPGLAVIDHTFILRLALQLVQGVNDALHTLMASSLTASMALVVDHAFLTKLALRSALYDDAFIHIRISYEPGGMFRLCSRQYSYCELAL